MIDHGKVIALGTSDELKSQVGGESIEVDPRPTPRDLDRGLHRRRGARRSGHRAPTRGNRRLTLPGRRRLGRPRRAAAASRRRRHQARRGGTAPTDAGRRVPAPHRARRRGEQTTKGPTTIKEEDHGMSAAESVSDAVIITRRNLKKILRVPDLLVFTLLSPIMFVLLFAFVFGGAIGTGHRRQLQRVPDAPGSSSRPSSSGPRSPATASPRTCRRGSSTGSGRCRCRRPRWSSGGRPPTSASTSSASW